MFKESKVPKVCFDALKQNLERLSPFWFCRKYLSLLQSSSVKLAQSWDFPKFELGMLSTFFLLFRGEKKMDWFLFCCLQVRKSVDAMVFLLSKVFYRGEDFYLIAE